MCLISSEIRISEAILRSDSFPPYPSSFQNCFGFMIEMFKIFIHSTELISASCLATFFRKACLPVCRGCVRTFQAFSLPFLSSLISRFNGTHRCSHDFAYKMSFSVIVEFCSQSSGIIKLDNGLLICNQSIPLELFHYQTCHCIQIVFANRHPPRSLAAIRFCFLLRHLVSIVTVIGTWSDRKSRLSLISSDLMFFSWLCGASMYYG